MGELPEGAERSVTRTASPSVRVRIPRPTDASVRGGAFEPGTRIDRYEVIERLGQGGMGTVYRVRDTELARDVALKWIDPTRFGMARAQRLLRREAQATARVEHPAVVRIYDVGVADGHLFVTMELVRGGALTTWLRARRRGWREVLGVFAEAGRGLAAAHRAGLVHRDVKPSNILLDERGHARVSDFGLARTLDGEDGDDPAPAGERDALVTRTGAFAGTPAYMAPEQLAGEPVDARADQFGFCVALWEALCGERPFPLTGTSPQALDALLGAILAGAIRPAGARVRVPRRLLAALRRGLSADPARRWSSMDDLLDALDRLARPRRWQPVVVAGLAAAAAVSGALAWARIRGATDEPVLPLGGAQPIAHSDNPWMELTMLPDGRYVRLEDGAISVISADGAPRALAVPPEVAPLTLRASAVNGWLEIWSRGERCTWWLAPVDGGPWRRLADDLICSAAPTAATSPDGGSLAIAQRGELRIRALATGAERVVWRALDAVAPAWSPDGTRLAVTVADRLVVIDAATGAEIARGGLGTGARWLDRDRLIYIAERSWTRSALRVLDLRTGTDRLIRAVDGRIAYLSAGRGGVLMELADGQSRTYVTAMAPSHPPSVDELTPLDTGATIDFVPLAWTPDGGVITIAAVLGQRGLIRTVPGRRGAPVVLHPGDDVISSGVSGDLLLYDIAEDERCALRAFDRATGRERALPAQPCSRHQRVRCARAAPRCVLIEDEGNHWIDPATLAVGGPAPALDLSERLSPDGTETVRPRADALVVRALATGAETAIELSPPVHGVDSVLWGSDPSTFLVNTYAGGHDRLLRVTRDGRWQTIVDDSRRRWINGAVASPDGAQVALVALRIEVTWSYLPFLPARR